MLDFMLPGDSGQGDRRKFRFRKLEGGGGRDGQLLQTQDAVIPCPLAFASAGRKQSAALMKRKAAAPDDLIVQIGWQAFQVKVVIHALSCSRPT